MIADQEKIRKHMKDVSSPDCFLVACPGNACTYLGQAVWTAVSYSFRVSNRSTWLTKVKLLWNHLRMWPQNLKWHIFCFDGNGPEIIFEL